MVEVKAKDLKEAVNTEYEAWRWGKKCRTCCHYNASYSFCNARLHVVSPNHCCEYWEKKTEKGEKLPDYDLSSDVYLFGKEEE